MAAKKPAFKASTGGKSLAHWDEKLAELAKRTKALEDTAAMGGNRISVRGGAMSFNGVAVPGNKLNCIVIDHCIEYVYYKEKFDPDNPTAPECFALSQQDAKKMVPHEAAMEPQAESCVKCKHNAFGSADTGRGKACGNKRRLVLIPEDALNDLESAEAAMFSVPVTSCRNWQGYVDNLATALRRPPLAVITEISCAPHAKHQVEVTFKLKSQIDRGDQIEALISKQEALNAMLMKPYEQQEKQEKPAPKTKGKAKQPASKARR
jgi:hypothetical protein